MKHLKCIGCGRTIAIADIKEGSVEWHCRVCKTVTKWEISHNMLILDGLTVAQEVMRVSRGVDKQISKL